MPTLLLNADEHEILARGKDCIDKTDWMGLYLEIKRASPYCTFQLLEHIRNQSSSKKISHDGISRLLKNCIAKPEDFEELGRPTRQFIHLDLRHLDSPQIHSLMDGTKLLIQNQESMHVLSTIELLSCESTKESSTNHAHNKPYPSGIVSVGPGGKYYLVYKRDNNTGHEQNQIFKAGQQEALFTFENSEHVDFISDHQVLLRQFGVWKQLSGRGQSWSEFLFPRKSVLNLDTQKSQNHTWSKAWSIPSSVSVECASNDGRVIIFRNRQYEPTNGCCPRFSYHYFVCHYSGNKRVREVNLDNQEEARVFFITSDGQRAAICRRNSIDVWNLESGTMIKKEFDLGEHFAPKAIAFDPIKNLIAIAGTGQISIFSMRTMEECVKLPARDTHELVFVDGHLLASDRFKWNAYSFGARASRNWEPSLELRRISLVAADSISEEKVDFVLSLAKSESWLSPPQSRWLHSLANLLNETRQE